MFVHLPGSSEECLKQIISSLVERGAEVSEFFHGHVTHLITSQRCLEMEKEKTLTSKKLILDPSSRGAIILARTTKKQNNINIVEKAKKFGVRVILIEERNFLKKERPLDFKLSSSSTLSKQRTDSNIRSVKVRELRAPFIKVADHSGRYRPLVMEMKEWPDAYSMFSQGPSVLDTKKITKKRNITFCELCEEHFNDLPKHLDSDTHVKNA